MGADDMLPFLHHEKDDDNWKELIWHFDVDKGSATFLNAGSGGCARAALALGWGWCGHRATQ